MFEEVGAAAGPALTTPRVSRGSAVGDIDNDGGLDLAVNNLDGPPLLARNEGAGRGHWLTVQLRGDPARQCPRDAIGSVVFVTAGGRRVRGEVASGRGQISQSDLRVHVGLGAHGGHGARGAVGQRPDRAVCGPRDRSARRHRSGERCAATTGRPASRDRARSRRSTPLPLSQIRGQVLCPQPGFSFRPPHPTPHPKDSPPSPPPPPNPQTLNPHPRRRCEFVAHPCNLCRRVIRSPALDAVCRPPALPPVDVLVVIPTYNERENLPVLVARSWSTRGSG